jgi:hypothetical protein
MRIAECGLKKTSLRSSKSAFRNPKSDDLHSGLSHRFASLTAQVRPGNQDRNAAYAEACPSIKIPGVLRAAHNEA